MIGTSMNPIGIDDADQPEVDMEALLQQKRNQALIEKAKLSKDKMQLALSVIKTTIKGDLKHKNMTLNRAIIDFYQNKIGINISFEHFHPRPDAQYSQQNEINPKQFFLYGVDFLQTSQLQDRFIVLKLNIEEMIWINSSTCKIKYKTKEEAREALELVVADPKYLSGKMDEETEGLPQGWFSLRSYPLYNFERQLLIRYSTEKEDDIEKQTLEKYELFEEAQAEFLPHIFQKFQAHKAFEAVARQIERQRMTQPRHNRNSNHDNRNRREGRSRTRENYPRQGRSPRNFNNRYDQENNPRRSYEPQSVRMREVHRVHYEHQPSDMRSRFRTENYDRKQFKVPKKGNNFYDCNSIEDDRSNLSFQFMSNNGGIQPQHSDDSSLGNEDQNASLSILVPSSSNRSKNPANLQDLSIVIEDDKPQQNKNNSSLDLSLICEPQKPKEPSPSNAMDSSIIMKSTMLSASQKQADLSVMINEQQNEKEGKQEQDYSIMLGIHEQLSPIQHENVNILDTSIQMTEIKDEKKKEKKKGKDEAGVDFLDYEKPKKTKRNYDVDFSKAFNGRIEGY